ncbi:hypothetical protein ACWEKM_19535 [Streptomyces sp. NPDC004752]
MATRLREVTDVTPWLRFTFRLVRLLLVLAAVLVPCGTATAYAPEATLPDTAGPSASAEPSRAGSRPAEGRPRPGRSDGPAAHTEGVDDSDASDDAVSQEGTEHEAGEDGDGGDDASQRDHGPWWRHEHDHDEATPTASESTQQAGIVPSATPSAEDAAGGRSSAAEPTMRLLPLGSGLVLIGLGLALAFVGLRVRRS